MLLLAGRAGSRASRSCCRPTAPLFLSERGGSRLNRPRLPGGSRRSLSSSSESGGGVVKAVQAGAIGVGAGVFGSLVGLGGAFVMIPALTGVLKASQHQAHGTSLAAVLTTGAGGALSYGAAGAVDWEAAGFVALLGMMSARLGARTTATLSAATLKRLQGVFQLIVAPTVPLRDEIVGLFTSAAASTDQHEQQQGGEEGGMGPMWAKRAQLGAIGLGSGFLSGLFGVGGGAVVVPALTICMPGLNHYTALGTSLAAMVPTAAVGTVTHYHQGNVLTGVVVPLAMGSAMGSFLGSKYVALNVPERELKWGFSVMMVVLGLASIRAGNAMAAAQRAAKAVGAKAAK